MSKLTFLTLNMFTLGSKCLLRITSCCCRDASALVHAPDPKIWAFDWNWRSICLIWDTYWNATVEPFAPFCEGWAIDDIRVKHQSGGNTSIQFFSVLPRVVSILPNRVLAVSSIRTLWINFFQV